MTLKLTRRILIAAGISSLATAALSRTINYELVGERSKISFIFTTSGARQTGTIPVKSADITIDTANLVRSQAMVTADIRQITSGIVFITQAIKSPDLLDAETHPIVRFQSRKILLGPEGRISGGAQIEGDLTLRGVTRPITLQASLTRPAGTPPDDLSVLYILLNGSLNRRDFGANGYAGLAEDRVDLDIRAEIRAQG